MKKWIFLFVLICVLLGWFAVDQYTSIQADKNKDMNKYASILREETGYNIGQGDRYHGEQLYYVFRAEDGEQNSYYLFINEEEEYQVLNIAEIQFSLDEAKQKALAQFSEIDQILRIHPAISGGEYTWEIVASNQSGRYQYIYYRMQDGTFQKRYQLTQLL